MFNELFVADGMHVGVLSKFMRFLVHLLDLVLLSRISPVQILQTFYGFTKGALESKTIVANHHGDTLEISERTGIIYSTLCHVAIMIFRIL
jgi:hypothetical protein